MDGRSTTVHRKIRVEPCGVAAQESRYFEAELSTSDGWEHHMHVAIPFDGSEDAIQAFVPCLGLKSVWVPYVIQAGMNVPSGYYDVVGEVSQNPGRGQPGKWEFDTVARGRG